MASRPKQFYIAERHPSTSREEFQRNWRGHGALAIGTRPLWDNIPRYTQGDRVELEAGVAARIRGLDAHADGVATIWFHDLDAVFNIPADPDHPTLLADEARIFAGMVADISVFTTEEILFEDSDVAVKLVVFVSRHEDDGAEVFAEAFRGAVANACESADMRQLLTACRLNWAFPLPLEEGAEDPSVLSDVDVVIEVGFAGVEQLVAAAATPGFARLQDELARTGEARRTLVTSELLLWPAGQA